MLIGFSMGGTLLRHAQYSAQKNHFHWLETLSKCIYLGNPNEGSPFDSIGHISRDVIRRFPLRYINLWAEWMGRRNNRLESLKQSMKRLSESQERDLECMSYADSSRHYFISGGNNKSELGIVSRVLGDTLAGENRNIPSSAPTNSQIARIEGLSSNYPVVNSGRVYQLIARWTKDAELIQCDHKQAEEDTLAKYSLAEESFMAEVIPRDLPKQVLIAGAVDFLASAYDKTLETFETMHYSITEEPFYMAQKLPVVSQIAKPIEAIHRNILDNFYRSLRSGGRLMHKVAADITPKQDTAR
jgi:hypothetical protein